MWVYQRDSMSRLRYGIIRIVIGVLYPRITMWMKLARSISKRRDKENSPVQSTRVSYVTRNRSIEKDYYFVLQR